MYLDPTIISWLLIAAASFCSLMIGKYWAQYDNDTVVENTIIYLVENNFVKAKKVDGELELIPLDKEE